MYCQSNNWWRFHKILWPSQNIWTWAGIKEDYLNILNRYHKDLSVSFFTFLRMNICMCDKTFMTSSFNLAVLEIKKVWNIFQTKINRKKSFSDKWPKTSTHHLFIRSCFHKSQICFTKFAACFDPLKTDFCLRIKIFK